MGCLLALPFQFLKWCFTSGIKGLVVLAVLALVFVIGCNVAQAKLKPAETVTAPTTSIPAIQVAPYVVQTSSRYYYAELAVKDKAGVVTMTNFYELSKTKWVLRKRMMILDPQVFGNVIMAKRK